MRTAVPDRVKPSFAILTSGHFDSQGWNTMRFMAFPYDNSGRQRVNDPNSRTVGERPTCWRAFHGQSKVSRYNCGQGELVISKIIRHWDRSGCDCTPRGGATRCQPVCLSANLLESAPAIRPRPRAAGEGRSQWLPLLLNSMLERAALSHYYRLIQWKSMTPGT